MVPSFDFVADFLPWTPRIAVFPVGGKPTLKLSGLPLSEGSRGGYNYRAGPVGDERGVSRSPDVATALTAQLRGAALELRWERLMERLRREMDSAQLERFDAATTEELDGLAKEAVTATRPSKT